MQHQHYSRSLAIIAAIGKLFAMQGQTAQTLAIAQNMSSSYVSRGERQRPRLQEKPLLAHAGPQGSHLGLPST